MSTLTGKKLSINLCSKPVTNLKKKHLHDRFLEYLDKASECGFDIFPIVMDCHATNVKVMKKLLKLENPTTNEKLNLVALLFETNFLHN